VLAPEEATRFDGVNGGGRGGELGGSDAEREESNRNTRIGFTIT